MRLSRISLEKYWIFDESQMMLMMHQRGFIALHFGMNVYFIVGEIIKYQNYNRKCVGKQIRFHACKSKNIIPKAKLKKEQREKERKRNSREGAKKSKRRHGMV